MIEATVSIEKLIALVRNGGRVRTGVDVYDRSGTLLLARDILVDQVRTLEIIRRQGLKSVPLARNGGVFDLSGNKIALEDDGIPERLEMPPGVSGSGSWDVATRLKEIEAIRREAARHQEDARICLKKALAQVRKNRGQFDVRAVETQAAELSDFVSEHDHPFSYLARDLFSHDDYLYTHAVNVCALGTAAVRRFNDSFSRAVETALWAEPAKAAESPSFAYYYPDDLEEISLGLFVYDMGKALVPSDLLNKAGALTREEFRVIRRHSYDFGGRILENNHLDQPILANMVQYHHGPLFKGDKNSYPGDREFSGIPPYVRICKLADIYHAMISRRSYRDAANQVAAATNLFRAYVHKEPMLQFLLHAFVSTIGLYPPGSIVLLRNGQMAYVLESRGPVVLPFTDKDRHPLGRRPDPFDAGQQAEPYQIDTENSVRTPKEVLHCLPGFIREIAVSDRDTVIP